MHETVKHEPRRRKKSGRLRRFFQGYLMIVGALTTGYVLLQLVIWLLVEIARFG